MRYFFRTTCPAAGGRGHRELGEILRTSVQIRFIRVLFFSFREWCGLTSHGILRYNCFSAVKYALRLSAFALKKLYYAKAVSVFQKRQFAAYVIQGIF